jgi:hypothetical protein
LGAIGRFISPPGYVPGRQFNWYGSAPEAPIGGRTAAAGEMPKPVFGERQGPPVPERILNAPKPPVLPAAGVAPGFGTTPVVRSDDDQYRQLLSQYGALAKAGKQEEAEKLGMEIWQKKYGKTAMGQPGGAVGSFNPLMQQTFGYQRGQEEQIPTTYAQQTPGTGFALAANAVPAPWNEQGFKVSQEFSGVVPFQVAKTTGSGMPAFQTTAQSAAEKAEQFLRTVKTPGKLI